MLRLINLCKYIYEAVWSTSEYKHCLYTKHQRFYFWIYCFLYNVWNKVQTKCCPITSVLRRALRHVELSSDENKALNKRHTLAHWDVQSVKTTLVSIGSQQIYLFWGVAWLHHCCQVLPVPRWCLHCHWRATDLLLLYYYYFLCEYALRFLRLLRNFWEFFWLRGDNSASISVQIQSASGTFGLTNKTGAAL